MTPCILSYFNSSNRSVTIKKQKSFLLATFCLNTLDALTRLLLIMLILGLHRMTIWPDIRQLKPDIRQSEPDFRPDTKNKGRISGKTLVESLQFDDHQYFKIIIYFIFIFSGKLIWLWT